MTLLVLEEASVLDAERGEVRANQSIVIEGDRIREVSDGSVRLDGARRLRLGGRTVMPGLIDAHVHVTVTSLDIGALFKKPTTLVAQEARVIMERMLRRGFTTVRDAGGCDWGLAEAVERGLIDGPRVFHSGRVLSQTAATETSASAPTRPTSADVRCTPPASRTSRTACRRCAKRRAKSFAVARSK